MKSCVCILLSVILSACVCDSNDKDMDALNVQMKQEIDNQREEIASLKENVRLLNLEIEKEQSRSNEKHIESKDDLIDDRFLITNSSVGYFRVGGSWRSVAKRDYKYLYIQKYGTCVDECCDGGFSLGYNEVDGEEGKTIENLHVIIGAVPFDEDGSEHQYDNNPDVFYVSTSNCHGWYWKNKISYIKIFSDFYRLREKVGAGSLLRDFKSKFGTLHFNLGWITEDPEALYFTVDVYPEINFVLDVDDCKYSLYDSSVSDDFKAKMSDDEKIISMFKEGTRVWYIVVFTPII